jgi:hypothetical protein
MKISELYPRFDRCKSFYGKALIKEDGERIILQSYESDVAFYHKDRNSVAFGEDADYSNTTLRHVREFLRYIDAEYKRDSIQQLTNVQNHEKHKSFKKLIHALRVKGSEVFLSA